MKAHILKLPQGILEFGKDDTVVVTLTMNSTEARRIREELHLDNIHAQGVSLRQLDELLAAVEYGASEIRKFNAIND